MKKQARIWMLIVLSLIASLGACIFVPGGGDDYHHDHGGDYHDERGHY